MLPFPYISWDSKILFRSLLCSLMMCANNQVYYGPVVVFVFLHIITLPHYYHSADVVEVIGSLKCLSGTFWRVCKIKSIFSILFHAIYGAMCIQLTHLSYDDCAYTCTLSYCHHQIGNLNHLLLFTVKSWNNGMRCMCILITVLVLRHT